MKLNYLLFLAFLSACTIACNSLESDINLSYESDIKPLLSSCSNLYCHGSYHPNGNTLSYENTVEFAKKESFLAALKHEPNFSAMPKGGDKLPDEDIALIERWIEEGMME